jgi:cytochrome c2
MPYRARSLTRVPLALLAGYFAVRASLRHRRATSDQAVKEIERDQPKLRASTGAILLACAGIVLVAALLFGGYRMKLDRDRHDAAVALTGGDPERGRELVLRYGCAGCHVVPSVGSPRGMVGPSLVDAGRRVYLGGAVTNTPANMIRWIVDPRQIDPRTAMPSTGISPSEARDVAAFLYSR